MFERKEMTEEQAFARLSAQCARQERSSGQVLERMRQWGLPDEARGRVLARLVEGRWVDDRRFCELFVSDKIRFGKWGRRKVEAALWQKGIGSDIAGPVLDAVDDSLYEEALTPLLKAKLRSVKGDTPYERRCRLMAYAAGRGFDMELAARCLEKLREE